MRMPQLNTVVRTIVVIALLASPLSAAEKLALSSLFTDHAVLQRDIAVPVWGKAEPKSEVTVEFAGQTKSAITAADGKWIVRLDPMPASAEPRELIVVRKNVPHRLTRLWPEIFSKVHQAMRRNQHGSALICHCLRNANGIGSVR